MPIRNDIQVLIGGDISALTKAMNNAEKRADKSSKAMSASFSGVATALAGIWAGIEVKETLIDTSQITASLRVIESGTDSVEEFTRVWGELKRQSAETGAALSNNVDFYKRMSLGLSDLNVSQSKMLELNDLINKSLVASGSSAEQVSSFQTQFVQGLQAGVIRGEEFNSVAESNVVMLQAMAKAYGTNVGGLRELAKAGALTTESFLEKLPSVAGDINSAFDIMPVTIGRASSQLTSAFKAAFVDSELASGGVNKIAESISILADTVTQNSPSIQSLFSAIVSGAQYAVQGTTALVAIFQGGSSAVSTLSGHVLSLVGDIAKYADIIGVNIGTTEEWKNNAKIAFQSADDLMVKAVKSMETLTNSTTGGTAALVESKSTVESLTVAEETRSAKTVEGINAITSAEKNATAERAKNTTDMFKAIGAGSEAYYQTEAQKILDQGAKWEELGASAIETQQWMYDQINALSSEAWAGEHQQAGQYLDGLTAGFTSATESISAEIDSLGDKTISVGIDSAQVVGDLVDTETAVDNFTEGEHEVIIDGDVSGVMDAVSVATTAINSIQGSLGTSMESVESLKAAIDSLNATSTLDPFGNTREKYEEQIKYLNELEVFKSAESAARRAEYEAELTETRQKDILDIKKEELNASKEIVKDRLDAEKDRVAEQLKMVEDSAAKESSILSAYRTMVGDTEGLADLTYFKAESDALTRQAQEWQEIGIDRQRIQQWLTDELIDLQNKATESGVSGLGSYNNSLLESAASTGNFSNSSAIANQEIEMLKNQLEALKDTSPDDLLSRQIAQVDALTTAVKLSGKAVDAAKEKLKASENRTQAIEKGEELAGEEEDVYTGRFARRNLSGLFANGGIMTGKGPMNLQKYSSGGIANSPQLALFGEGSKPEAYVPLPDGRTIPVTITSPDNTGQKLSGESTPVINITNHVHISQKMTNSEIEKLAQRLKINSRRTFNA